MSEGPTKITVDVCFYNYDKCPRYHDYETEEHWFHCYCFDPHNNRSKEIAYSNEKTHYVNSVTCITVTPKWCPLMKEGKK